MEEAMRELARRLLTNEPLTHSLTRSLARSQEKTGIAKMLGSTPSFGTWLFTFRQTTIGITDGDLSCYENKSTHLAATKYKNKQNT